MSCDSKKIKSPETEFNTEFNFKPISEGVGSESSGTNGKIQTSDGNGGFSNLENLSFDEDTRTLSIDPSGYPNLQKDGFDFNLQTQFGRNDFFNFETNGGSNRVARLGTSNWFKGHMTVGKNSHYGFDGLAVKGGGTDNRWNIVKFMDVNEDIAMIIKHDGSVYLPKVLEGHNPAADSGYIYSGTPEEALANGDKVLIIKS